MNRTELLNHLIRQRGLKRYLEIGVGNADSNFAYIECDGKVGVDLKPVTTFSGTSDTFFAHNQDLFDLIFIDGLHTEEQVWKDITNACLSLATGGLIVLHDCLPPDTWHQRELDNFQEGQSWNGQVWKAALRFFNQTSYQCFVLDTDWGCGIIDTAQTQIPARIILPETLNYEDHYGLLSAYKVSVAVYLRNQVSVFYHLACMGNWQTVFTEQMHQLWQSGFHQLNLTILGEEDDLQTASMICNTLGLVVQVIFRASEMTHFETPAMLAIEAHAQQYDGYVLYLHSKGVSNPSDSIKIQWRQLMMRELIENWEECVLQLQYHDAIGVNWCDMGRISHFSGNFWYASTRYIRQLANFLHYYANPHYHIRDALNDKRLGCEFWIGSSTKPAHVHSLVCRNENFCAEDYWKNHPF